ncbi:hypothetical protein HDU81_001559, partial [Chytriomyces hyalinus]
MLAQQFPPQIKDHLQAKAEYEEFPPLLSEILETLTTRRGVVANGVGLSDLTHSPRSYGVSYFAAGENRGYYVSTRSGDKAVPATFLFPAMVLNSSSMTFTPPGSDASFTVGGLYCRVMCDEYTSAGVQSFLESETVLKDGQTVKGKRFEFGTAAFSGATNLPLYTRFSRTY